MNLQNIDVSSADWVYQRLMVVLCVCQGESALFLAAASNRTEVVGILIEAGADIDLKENDVRSADWVWLRLTILLCVPGNHCTYVGCNLSSH